MPDRCTTAYWVRPKSDGAFYTNNLSAIMLARLALSEDFVDWSDAESVSRLRIIDPACGTGTLLMAALRTIMARLAGSRELDPEERNALHRRLVEDVLCGLDINLHAVQLGGLQPHARRADGRLRAHEPPKLNFQTKPSLIRP